MFFSLLLLSARSVPGRQWIGKNRKIAKITKTQRQTVIQQEKRIEEVIK